MPTVECNIPKTHVHVLTKLVTARPRAFTLMEILVVIGIITLLVLLALPAFNMLTGSRNDDSADNQLSAALAVARTQAIGLQQTRGLAIYHDQEQDRTIAAIVEVRNSPFIDWISGTTTNPQTYAYGEYRTRGTTCYVCIEAHVSTDSSTGPSGTGNDYWRSLGTATSINNEVTNPPTAPGLVASPDIVELISTGDQIVLPRGIDVRAIGNRAYYGVGSGVPFTYMSPAVILFDASGQVAASPFRILKRGLLGNKIDFQQPTVTPYSATADPYRGMSAVGIVTFNPDAYKNTATALTGTWPPTAAEAQKRTENDEVWFDQNATPAMINRYNGTLVKGE